MGDIINARQWEYRTHSRVCELTGGRSAGLPHHSVHRGFVVVVVGVVVVVVVLFCFCTVLLLFCFFFFFIFCLPYC